MAIAKRTFIDQIEIARTGRVQIRLALALEEDGEPIGEPKLHRSAVELGGDPEAQLALVEADIMARPELKAAPIDRDHMVAALKAVCARIKVSA